MTILMLAFGIYIVGVAVVLFIRPQTMFHENTWKEFGLGNNGLYTIFPFWLFTFVWAVISYAIATVGNLYIAKLALLSINTKLNNIASPISTSQATNTPLPGYYLVQPQTSGTPQFVYFGTNPPTLANLAHAR
jgi:hypothetical protein